MIMTMTKVAALVFETSCEKNGHTDKRRWKPVLISVPQSAAVAKVGFSPPFVCVCSPATAVGEMGKNRLYTGSYCVWSHSQQMGPLSKQQFVDASIRLCEIERHILHDLFGRSAACAVSVNCSVGLSSIIRRATTCTIRSLVSALVSALCVIVTTPADANDSNEMNNASIPLDSPSTVPAYTSLPCCSAEYRKNRPLYELREKRFAI